MSVLKQKNIMKKKLHFMNDNSANFQVNKLFKKYIKYFCNNRRVTEESLPAINVNR